MIKELPVDVKNFPLLPLTRDDFSPKFWLDFPVDPSHEMR
jgi:hypothetical protein